MGGTGEFDAIHWEVNVFKISEIIIGLLVSLVFLEINSNREEKRSINATRQIS